MLMASIPQEELDDDPKELETEDELIEFLKL
jgi:hypothetical protein